MPPKIKSQDFETYWKNNRGWFESKNWSKDLAERAFIYKNLSDEDKKKFSPYVDKYNDNQLKDLYSYYDNSSKNTPDTNKAVQTANQPNPTNTQVTEPIQYYTATQQNSVADETEYMAPTPEGYKAVARDRYHSNTPLEIDNEATQSEINKVKSVYDKNNNKFKKDKTNIEGKLRAWNDTWYTENEELFDQDNNDDSDEWWKETLATYNTKKFKKGEKYADEYLKNAVINRVNDTYSGWKAAAHIVPQMLLKMTASLSATAGLVVGVFKGLYNMATDAHGDVYNLGQEFFSGVIESKLVGLGTEMEEQGTVDPKKNFDPSLTMPGYYIAPNQVIASGVAQIGYGIASTIASGGELIVARAGAKYLNKLSKRFINKELIRMSSTSAKRLAGETAEAHAARLAALKAKDMKRQRIGMGVQEFVRNADEAIMDARSNYNTVMDYGTQAIDMLCEQEAMNNMMNKEDYSGYRNMEEWLNAKTSAYMQKIYGTANLDEYLNKTMGLLSSPETRPHSIDREETQESIINSWYEDLNNIREQYKAQWYADLEKEMNNSIIAHDMDYENHVRSVAIKSATRTFLEEQAVLNLASIITERSFRFEQYRNLRRGSDINIANRFLGDKDRYVTWDKAKNRAQAHTTSNAKNWFNAGAMFTVNGFVGEVIPEELQSFAEAANSAIGMNAIDQFIIARANGDNPDVGDLGDNRFKTGLKAGWNEIKENGVNVALTTGVSLLTPRIRNINLIGRRPEDMSRLEHLTKIFGNELIDNYYMQNASNNRVRFYENSINSLLDESPFLQEVVQTGLTLDNFSSLQNAALEANDMASFQATELGQLVSLMIDMHASGITTNEDGTQTNPLKMIEATIDKVADGNFSEEEKTAYLENAKKNGPEPNKIKQKQTNQENKSDEELLEELKKSAKRMQGIRSSIESAYNLVQENFQTYDDDIKTALIFGKAFNDAFEKDVMSEKEEADKMARSYIEKRDSKGQNKKNTERKEAATMDDIRNMKSRKRINEERESISRLTNIFDGLKELKETIKNAKTKEDADTALDNYRAKNKNNSITKENIDSQIKRAESTIKRKNENLAKLEKSVEKALEGKDIEFTAEDFINSDVDTRRWLLNKANWDLLSKESKKNISELLNAMNAVNPSFEKTARHAANLEKILNENEEALTAYIADPNKLRPVYSRVMKARREQVYNNSLQKILEAETYDEFVKAYDEYTSSESKRSISLRNSIANAAKTIERNKYIDKKLANNEFFKEYKKRQKLDIALKNACSASVEQKHKLRKTNLTEEQKQMAQIYDTKIANRKILRNELLYDFINQYKEKINIEDIGDISSVLNEIADGHTNDEPWILKSKYGEFVRKKIEELIQQNKLDDCFNENDIIDIRNKINPERKNEPLTPEERIMAIADELSFKSEDEAKNRYQELINYVNRTNPEALQSNKEEKKEEVSEDANQQKNEEKQEDVTFAWSEHDDEKYSEPLTNKDLESKNKYEIITRKILYNFRILSGNSAYDAVFNNIKTWLSILEREKKNENKTEEFNENIIGFVKYMQSYNVDKSNSTVYNLKTALKNYNLNENNYFNATINSTISALGTMGLTPLNEAKAEINTGDSSKTIESMHIGQSENLSGDHPTLWNAIQKIYSDFAEAFKIDDFLNGNNANDMIMRRKNRIPFKIFSGDFKFKDNEGKTLNELIEDEFDNYASTKEDAPKFDKDKHGALIVAYDITNNTILNEENKEAIVSDEEGHKYRIVAILPTVESSNDSMISNLRLGNTKLWENEEDMKTKPANVPLYLSRNGVNFFWDSNNISRRDLKNVKIMFESFQDFFRSLKAFKIEKGDKTSKMIGVTPSTGGLFSLRKSRNQSDHIEIDVTPMNESRSINGNRRTIAEILNTVDENGDATEATISELRDMHLSGGHTGRMGTLFFVLRRAILYENYEEITNIINSISNRADKAKLVLTLSKDYTLEYKENRKTISLIDINNNKHSVKLPKIDVSDISDADKDKMCKITYKDDNADSQDGITKQDVINEIDKFIFKLLREIIMSDGNVRMSGNSPVVKWNLFYGGIKASQQGEKLDGEKRTNEEKKSTYHIFLEFYEDGLLQVKHKVRNLFFTTDKDEAYDKYKSQNSYIDDNTPIEDENQNSNKPGDLLINKLINKAKRVKKEMSGKIHAQVTALTSIIDGEKDEFDEESKWAGISSAVGNNVDQLCRDFFKGSIVKNKETGEFYYNSENKSNPYSNISDEGFQELANSLEKIKDELSGEGFKFISDEITLEGMTFISDGEKKTNFPIIGIPDIIAYKPDTGEMRIIDVKTKHTNSKEEPTFWSSKDDSEHLSSPAATKVNRYSGQLTLYKQMVESMSDGDIEVKGLYILEVPVLYASPDSKNVEYSIKNKIAYISKKGDRTTKSEIAKADIGKVTLHQRDEKNVENSFNIYDRYRMLVRNLAKINEEILKIEKFENNKQTDKVFASRKENLLKQKNKITYEITQLTDIWKKKFKEDEESIDEKAGRIEVDNKKSSISFTPSIIAGVKRQANEDKDKIDAKTIVLTAINGMSIADCTSGTIKINGKGIDPKGTIKVTDSISEGEYYIDEYGDLYIRKDFIIEQVEKSGILPPNIMIDRLISCKM